MPVRRLAVHVLDCDHLGCDRRSSRTVPLEVREALPHEAVHVSECLDAGWSIGVRQGVVVIRCPAHAGEE